MNVLNAVAGSTVGSLFVSSQFIIGVMIFIVIASIIAKGYVKAPQNTAYIITGIRKKVLIGKSSVVIPIVERVDKLYLGLISVDVKNNATPTYDFVQVDIDGVVKLEVDKSEEGLRLASENFLNHSPEEIAHAVIEVLEGNMREITGQMTLESMIQNRKEFGEKVEENAQPDMAKMGLKIVAFNIQSFDDELGVIKDLGAENIERIQKDAKISKATANRDVRIKEAEAENLAHTAEVESILLQKERQNAANIKTARLEAESNIERAKSEKAREIELEKQALRVTEERIKVEKYRAREEISLKEDLLDATIKKEADAQLYRAQKAAEAEKARRIADAEAEAKENELRAKAIEEKGRAEAEAIRAKELAVAEGLMKKAEAMERYGEAATLEMIVKVLPEIAKAVAEPLTSIGNITMYGEGNVAKMTEDITKSTRQVIDGVFDSTGINLGELLSSAVQGQAIGASHFSTFGKNRSKRP